MVYMKTLDEIDLTLYSFFALTEEKDNIQIDINIASGYQPFDDCDLFSIPEGTIIAFKAGSFYGFHNIRITGSKVDYIQLNEVSLLDSVFNEHNISGYNFYAFCNSVVMPNTYAFNDKWTRNDHAPFIRCDYQKMGAVTFYPANNGYNITKFFNLLNISGIGHIVRFETTNDRNMNPGTQIDYTAAKTLAGTFKQISEWKIVSKEPFNNQEDIAIKANLFIDNLNLGDEIWSDINSATGDLPLAQYIRGSVERSPELEDTSIAPESLKDYLKSHYLYSTLHSLKQTHPNGSAIPDSAIQKEKIAIAQRVFEFCLIHGLDFNNYQGILDYFSEHPNQEFENLIAIYNQIV